jgi:hypothetical protein
LPPPASLAAWRSISWPPGTPGSRCLASRRTGEAKYTDPTGLDQLPAALLYSAYTVLLVAAGIMTTRRRDVLAQSSARAPYAHILDDAYSIFPSFPIRGGKTRKRLLCPAAAEDP